MRGKLFIGPEATTNWCLEGDGGAYPECHVAQYPLDLGRKKVRVLRSNSLVNLY